MNFYSLILTNLEFFIPEIFLIISFLGLIFYGSIVQSYTHILTFYTNKISFCIIIILLILLSNTVLFNCNYEYNFLLLIKFIISLSILICLILSENYILQKFEFSFLILLSLIGFFILVMSFDLILVYLAIEIQSFSFYILSCMKRNSAFSTEAGLKYFILGALASGLFLFGSSLIYGITGTINLKDLSNILIIFQIQQESAILVKEPLLIIASLCILFSLFFKLAIAPYHVWSPDVYEGAPLLVTAFFSITSKLSLFIILIRFFNYVFYDSINLIFWWKLISVYGALFSIFIGSIIALQQTKIKRLLVYSTIGHVGYILIGVVSGNSEGIQSLFFYLIIYILSSLCIWGSILILNNIRFISELKIVKLINPFLFINLIVNFFSLAGIPPLAGFLAKLSIFISALNSNLYIITLLIVFLSIISTFYYLKLIKILTVEKIVHYNFSFTVKSISKLNSIIISISFLSLFLIFIFPLQLSLLTYYLNLIFI